MATYQEFIDQLIEGELTSGGGIDQADLLIEIVKLAQDMAVSQHEVGLGLISFIRDQMADPFNILNATALFGQVGGGTLAPAAGFAASGGQPSAFGPLFDELLQSVSQFALGEFDLPELPELPGGDAGDGDGDGGGDGDGDDVPGEDRDLEGESTFSQAEWLARTTKVSVGNATQKDALWFTQYADFWRNQPGTSGGRIATAEAYATLISELNAGITQLQDAEARLRELISGGAPAPTTTPPTTPPTVTPGDPAILTQIVKWAMAAGVGSDPSQASLVALQIRQTYPELESLAVAYTQFGAGKITSAQLETALREYRDTGTVSPITPTTQQAATSQQVSVASTAQVNPLKAVQEAGVPLVSPITPKKKKTVL